MAADPNATRSPLRVLLDTNVALDWLLDRKPWADAAQPFWDARDADQIACYMPASALTDVFYIARRQIGIASLDLIITRNTPDFAHAGIPAIEPPAIARYLSQP